MRNIDHYLRAPAILVLPEALLFFFAVYVAASLRFEMDVARVEDLTGPLWPRALIIAAAMLVCMGLMGLYSPRLRETYAGTIVRIIGSTIAAVTATVLISYAVPTLFLGRGVLGWSALLLLLFAATTRLVWALLRTSAR